MKHSISMRFFGIWHLMLIFLFYAPEYISQPGHRFVAGLCTIAAEKEYISQPGHRFVAGLCTIAAEKDARFNAIVCSTTTAAPSAAALAAHATTSATTITSAAAKPTRIRSFHSLRKPSLNHKTLLMIQSATQTANNTTAIATVTMAAAAAAAATTSILTTAAEAAKKIAEKRKAIDVSFAEGSTTNSLNRQTLANATTTAMTKELINAAAEAATTSVTSSAFTTKATASAGAPAPSTMATQWPTEDRKYGEWIAYGAESSNTNGSSNNIKTINSLASRNSGTRVSSNENEPAQQQQQQQRLYQNQQQEYLTKSTRAQENGDSVAFKQRVRQAQQQIVQQQVPTAVADTSATLSTDFERQQLEPDGAAVDKNYLLPANLSPGDKLEVTLTTLLLGETAQKSAAANLDDRAAGSLQQRPTNTTEATLAKLTSAGTAGTEAVTDASLTAVITAATTTTTTTATTTAAEKPILPLAVDGYETITSQAGTHAYLPCNVKHLVKKPISWLRVRDGHILTVDQTTFIADQRFQSIYVPNPERWSLQIKYVQPKDAGSYECQVSTEPKASAIVTLLIVEPKTELIGESTRHVKVGSLVKLRCVISEALEPPLFINWFHNQKQIYLHNQRDWRTEIERTEVKPEKRPSSSAAMKPKRAQRDEISATTTTAAKPMRPILQAASLMSSLSSASSASSVSSSLSTGKNQKQILPVTLTNTLFIATTTTTTTTSTTEAAKPHLTPAGDVEQITTASLIIPSVEKQDSGNYTCSPSNSAPRTVALHVLNGEFSASAITSGANPFFVRSENGRSRHFCEINNLAVTLILLGIYRLAKSMTLDTQRQAIEISECAQNDSQLTRTMQTTQTSLIQVLRAANFKKLYLR